MQIVNHHTWIFNLQNHSYFSIILVIYLPGLECHYQYRTLDFNHQNQAVIMQKTKMHQYICYHNMLKHGGNANASLRTIHSELPISIFKKTYGQLYVLEITFL